MAAGESTKVIVAALIANGCISIAKFVAAFFTGSSAMISEGVHSLTDTVNQILLLYGIKASKKPADKNFPFGHGKEIYFWSFVVAILIFAIGAGISFYEGIHHVIHPKRVENPIVNYIVLGVSMVFESIAWLMAFKEFKTVKGNLGYFEAVQKGKDPSLFVILFEDSAAMLGLLVALGGIFIGQITGNFIYDGIASIIIGLILGGTAIWLAIETKGLLIGEGADEEVSNGIHGIISELTSVENVNEVLTLHMGPDFILVNVSVDFKNDLSAGEVENTIANMDKRIKEKFFRVKRVFIEAESRN